MIVTGHGSFATGITSGLKLLAGEPEAFESVDFTPEDSVDSLKEKLKAALERLQDCEEVIIFTDLTGGSPFNVSIGLKMEMERELQVIGGTNLPVVLNAFMARMMGTEAGQLAEDSLKAGKEAMVRFEAGSDEDDEYEE